MGLENDPFSSVSRDNNKVSPYKNNSKRHTPCFWMETLVRCTNMLSSSLTLALYLTVQKRQNPSLYLMAKSHLYFLQAKGNLLKSKQHY